MNTVLKTSFTLAVVAASFAFVSFLSHQTQLTAALNDIFFKGIRIDSTNNESKWILIRTLFLELSLFVLAHCVAVMLIRLFTGRSSPATTQDSTFIKLLNKIIQNTIQQSFIFLGLYIYFLFDGPCQRLSANNLLNLPTWFILGRILFSVGYIIGTPLNLPQLRSFGFALSPFVNVLLIEQIFLPRQFIAQTFLQ